MHTPHDETHGRPDAASCPSGAQTWRGRAGGATSSVPRAAGDPHTAAATPASGPLPMVAATLTHMTRFLQSGCPRAAQLSEMLLDELDRGADLPAELREACRQLQEVIWPQGRYTPAVRP